MFYDTYLTVELISPQAAVPLDPRRVLCTAHDVPPTTATNNYTTVNYEPILNIIIIHVNKHKFDVPLTICRGHSKHVE